MIELINDFGLLAICLAAYLDVLVFTGVVFNGTLLLAVATTLYGSGAAEPRDVFLLSLAGTFLASSSNFLLGRIFKETEWMDRVRGTNGGQRVQKVLQGKGLLPAMIALRFITICRPIYSVTLGALGVSVSRFLIFEFLASVVWVSFWTAVLVGGYSGISEFLEATF